MPDRFLMEALRWPHNLFYFLAKQGFAVLQCKNKNQHFHYYCIRNYHLTVCGRHSCILHMEPRPPTSHWYSVFRVVTELHTELSHLLLPTVAISTAAHSSFHLIPCILSNKKSKTMNHNMSNSKIKHTHKPLEGDPDCIRGPGVGHVSVSELLMFF